MQIVGIGTAGSTGLRSVTVAVVGARPATAVAALAEAARESIENSAAAPRVTLADFKSRFEARNTDLRRRRAREQYDAESGSRRRQLSDESGLDESVDL